MELQKENLTIKLLKWLKDEFYKEEFKIDYQTKLRVSKALGCSIRSLDNPLAKLRKAGLLTNKLSNEVFIKHL
jgi:hypothetical protein